MSGSGRYRDQPGDGAIEARKQVDAAQDLPGDEQRRQGAGRAREIRVDQHDAHAHGVAHGPKRQLRTAVEPATNLTRG